MQLGIGFSNYFHVKVNKIYNAIKYDGQCNHARIQFKIKLQIKISSMKSYLRALCSFSPLHLNAMNLNSILNF